MLFLEILLSSLYKTKDELLKAVLKNKKEEEVFIKMKNAIILIIVAVMVFGTMYLSNAHDHTLFYSVPEGEITVVETDCPIYLPKGAYIIGECHNYSVDEGIVFDDTLPENQALKFEKLVKVYGEAVIYWSLDQKDEAKKMLLDS